MRDLILLVPDKNTHFALTGALQRPEALGIRSIEFSFNVHSGRDGGVRRSGAQILALQRRMYSHALMVLDYDGSGSPLSVADLEETLDGELRRIWEDNGKTIVIEPEVDIWMWGSDNAVQEVIGWSERTSVRDYLRDQGFEFTDNGKPKQPKEALELLLRVPDVPRSSALYQLRKQFDAVAEGRNKKLVEAHERFSRFFRAGRFEVVYPVLPMDIMGLYVLLPNIDQSKRL